MRLKGQVAVVTGAGRGIGRAAAELFAAEGACTVLVDVREDLGNQVLKSIAGHGGEARFVRADVAHADEVRGIFVATK